MTSPMQTRVLSVYAFLARRIFRLPLTHQGASSGILVSAVTIDLKSGDALTLSDIIDVSILTEESLMTEYTLIHKDSQIVEETKQFFLQEKFLIYLSFMKKLMRATFSF